jgi:LacI family transcriptional regulator
MSLRTTYESELDKLPDIFLCANDFVAMDAMAVLRKRGIRVPDDVLFCGFDDSPESRLLSLTTVHIHTQIMAFEAARLLLSRIKEPSLDYRTVYTESYLIERESTQGSEKGPRAT